MRLTFLPFAKPSISKKEVNEVIDTLCSNWLTSGPKVRKFEKLLKLYINDSSFALTVNSATSGIHLALLSLDIGPGDEVITTPMTFASTLNMIELVGANIKLVDINRNTYNIDIDLIEAAISSKTKAILLVHFAGLPVDLDNIYYIAKKYNLKVIEDAAHAIGAEYKNKKIGSFGDIQIFSFHPNKNITTGEGGCIITRSEKWARHMRLLRFHGIDTIRKKFDKISNPHYQIIAPGFKYNMMDIQAALGIHQLPKLDNFIKKRTQLANRYMLKLKDFIYLKLPQIPKYQHKHAWHLFTPTINTKVTKITRDQLLNKLKKRNIGCGIHYKAMHLYPYYSKKYGFKEGNFINAENVGKTIISLPLFPEMSENDQDDVLEALDYIFKKG